MLLEKVSFNSFVRKMKPGVSLYLFVPLIAILTTKSQVYSQTFKRDNQRVSYAHFVKNPFTRLNSFVLAGVRVYKFEECNLHCINKQDCFSVNFGKSNDGTHLCELLNTDRFNRPSEFVADQGFDHYNIKVRCA